MPELPEVETIARRLRDGNKREPRIVGRTVVAARVPSKKALKEPKPARFAEQIVGARFTGVRRRAKHLILETDRGALLVHLRLTGDLHVVDARAEPPRFVRVGLDLDDGHALVFTDGRHLGEVRLVADPAPHLVDLGPEPLADDFTVDVLARALTGKRAIKAVLLDQSVVAGVGNIYADESLFRARIWPGKRADKLTKDEVKGLHAGIRASLTQSIDELAADDGDIAWRYEERRGGKSASPFQVYDRAGEPCRRCKTKLKALKVAGRTTVVCPKCQRRA